MSNAGRRFIITGLEYDDHFYGMQVGDVFIACENPEGYRGIWIDPAQHPTVTEEGFKDYEFLCMVCCESELTKENKLIQELVDGEV